MNIGLLFGEYGSPTHYRSVLLGDLLSHILTYQDETLSSDFISSVLTRSETVEEYGGTVSPH